MVRVGVRARARARVRARVRVRVRATVRVRGRARPHIVVDVCGALNVLARCAKRHGLPLHRTRRRRRR
jgi:hypothetical protein